MIAEQPTRKVVKELAAAGWSRTRMSASSHAVWHCPSGQHSVSVPEGHRTITPGVVRSINKGRTTCDCEGEA